MRKENVSILNGLVKLNLFKNSLLEIEVFNVWDVDGCVGFSISHNFILLVRRIISM